MITLSRHQVTKEKKVFTARPSEGRDLPGFTGKTVMVTPFTAVASDQKRVYAYSGKEEVKPCCLEGG